MKKNPRPFVAIIVIFLVLCAAGVRPAEAVEKCEVDIESDGGDADDVCVVTSANPQECTLKKVIEHAYQDKWCAIDHNQKYGAFVFIQDPVEGTPSPSNKNMKPGETTLTQTISLPGKLPNDGSDQYDKGSGDPLVITGYLLQYTMECLAKGCSNPSSGDWEDSVLDGAFWEPQNRNHDMFDIDQWGVKEKNGDDWDPVIEMPPVDDDGEYEDAIITVDLNDAGDAAFEAKIGSYVQFRYITLDLKSGAAFDFENVDLGWRGTPEIAAPSTSFLSSRITVAAGNAADHIFKGLGWILQDAMGGTSPAIIAINRTTSADEPFAIFKIEDNRVDRKELVRDLRGAIAFETANLPSGISLVTWDGAEPLSCTMVGPAGAFGKMSCRMASEDTGEIKRVIRLAEYDGGEESDETIYTVGNLEEVIGDVISVAQGETVFAGDGRRIEVEMPTCPDGSVATADLTCTIENGTFEGFTEDGGLDILCNKGYKEETGVCVLDCGEHTSPSEDGTGCVIDKGFEWNVDHTAISTECAGDAVPGVNGQGCVCADDDLEVWQDAGGEYHCKRRCTDPLMSRDERGNCACPEGYRKRSRECVLIEEDRPGDRAAGSTQTTKNAGAGTEADLPDTTSCLGLTCFDTGDHADLTGSDADAAEPKNTVSGCSLAPASSAANSAWVILLLVLPILLFSLSLSGERVRVRGGFVPLVTEQRLKNADS